MKQRAEIKLFGVTIGVKELIIFTFVLAIVLRLVYGILTSPYERQHDFWDQGYGHYEYVKIIANDFKLPDNNKWQFYHPPLSHGIMAGVYKVLSPVMIKDGLPDDYAIADVLQFLPLIYSIILLFAFYKIMKELNIDEKYQLFGLMFFGFHPSNIILSASMNNDMLTYMFYGLAMLYTIKWYKKPTMKNIVILGLMIALSTISKFSGVTIAPIPAVVFLYVFIKNKDLRIKLIGQFAVFAVVCVPLAMSYTIRNCILFKQPIGYVADLGKTHPQFISNNLFERIFGFYSNEWKSPFPDGRKINILFASMKTSTFGEYSRWNNIFGAGFSGFLGALLLMSNITVSIATVILSVKFFILSKCDKIFKFILIGNFAVQFLLYIYFNISYPYSCTTDFRYLLPVLISGGVLYALGLDTVKESENKRTFGMIAGMFCAMSFVFYLFAA